MAHGTRISGVNMDVTAGFTRINGVNKKITKGLTLVGGVQKDINFASGDPVGNLAVGSSVFITINGAKKEFIVAHQGLPSSVYDSSCDGTWLLMKGIYESRVWHSSSNNSYKESAVHGYLNGDFLSLIDANVRPAIKQAKIPYVNGTGSSGSGSLASGANGLSAKVFLLSGYEIGWDLNTSHRLPGLGVCLSHFVEATASTRIAYSGNSATNWWLRSPYVGEKDSVWAVSRSGSAYDDYCFSAHGIRPAIIVKPETLYNPNTMEVLG